VRAADNPIKPEENEAILLVSAYKDFFKYGLKRFPKAKIIEVDSAYYHARNFDTIIFCLSDKYSLGVLQKIMYSYPISIPLFTGSVKYYLIKLWSLILHQ